MKESYLIFGLTLTFFLTAISCSGKSAADEKQISTECAIIEADSTAVSINADTARVIYQSQVYYTEPFDREKAFIVVSKRDTRLSVYADINGDTILVAEYPVCLSKNLGQKQRSGDMRTPESEPGKPFKITQIQDASDWDHDFGDGRGPILAYGAWFLRLGTPPHKGIGIHGSTNNESSVPGRASEGCVRLLDADIIHLKENYAYKGMPVIIKTEGQGALPFER